ncbi:MAG: AAA family ATPase, partial [Gammaproteobacteria bacterium]|nr:AAA family ATPase [Gammaproteobacteria bacterium]
MKSFPADTPVFHGRTIRTGSGNCSHPAISRGTTRLKVIATYNIKGGVGKTATAVNLAWLAAREGAPTLVWDLDPQGAASYYFRIKPRIKGGGKRLVQGKRDLDDFIRGTDYELLDLLPADFSYRNMDLFLEQAKNPVRQLHKLL